MLCHKVWWQVNRLGMYLRTSICLHRLHFVACAILRAESVMLSDWRSSLTRCMR